MKAPDGIKITLARFREIIGLINTIRIEPNSRLAYNIQAWSKLNKEAIAKLSEGEEDLQVRYCAEDATTKQLLFETVHGPDGSTVRNYTFTRDGRLKYLAALREWYENTSIVIQPRIYQGHSYDLPPNEYLREELNGILWNYTPKLTEGPTQNL